MKHDSYVYSSGFSGRGERFQCEKCDMTVTYAHDAEERVYYAVEEYWACRYDCVLCPAA